MEGMLHGMACPSCGALSNTGTDIIKIVMSKCFWRRHTVSNTEQGAFHELGSGYNSEGERQVTGMGWDCLCRNLDSVESVFEV